MDSHMLNAFHEDPYEGNFMKYDNESNFWSNDNADTIGLQLTETLNDILPIGPVEETLLRNNDEENKNLLLYNNFVEQQLNDHDESIVNAYRIITEKEVEIALNDNEDDAQSQCSNSTFRSRTDSSSIADYESHSSDYEDVEQVFGSNGLDFEAEKNRKNRTISSNTACSDADGLGLNIDANNFDLAEFITKDDFILNANGANTNDKAKEDLQSKPQVPLSGKSIPASEAVPKVSLQEKSSLLPEVTILKKTPVDDDDSDTIIDVETVDVDESEWSASRKSLNCDDLSYVDNVKADPIWCPKQTKKGSTSSAKKKNAQTDSQEVTPAMAKNTNSKTVSSAKPKSGNNICLVPNKKQCDFLKRAKIASLATTTKSSAKVVVKKTQEATTKQMAKIKDGTVANLYSKRVGVGGKNLALLKQEQNINSPVPESVSESKLTVALPTGAAATVAATTNSQQQPLKRKLNLEEYKKRRCGDNIAVPDSMGSKQSALSISKSISCVPHSTVSKAAIVTSAKSLTTATEKEAISNVVKSLKSPIQPTAASDPITVAKNKVLRMLELKRAQQLKILDSRVSAKVPRVTKLPPLKDIVKGTYCMPPEEQEASNVSNNSKLHPDYEEIIIVSASCNTDITIPPFSMSCSALKDLKAMPSSRSLLKSSVLLYNMSNNKNATKNIGNSLIASIQREVVKKSSCILEQPMSKPDACQVNENTQHGEDMVIMHLPKDRVRKSMSTMGTQTEVQAWFPLLTLPTVRASRECTRRSYRKRRDSSSDSSSSSSKSSCSSLSPAGSNSPSNSGSIERQLQTEAALPACCGSSVAGSVGCGYSSRSTHRHRSSVSSSSYSEAGRYERQHRRQRRTSYNKRRPKNHTRSPLSTTCSEDSDRSRSPHRQRRTRSRSISPTRYGNNNRRSYADRNVSEPAVEERRIVYVGRIEPETTKEMLLRKFLVYGPIKQITIHYKGNGMKYGFVTFECAKNAFAAIDNSQKDIRIKMYDVSFGGRRAFCRASYADLDNAGINNYQTYAYPKAAPPPPKQEDSFEALLLSVKAKLNANKPVAPAAVPMAASNNNDKGEKNTENHKI